jgi:ribosomal protein S27AE
LSGALLSRSIYVLLISSDPIRKRRAAILAGVLCGTLLGGVIFLATEEILFLAAIVPAVVVNALVMSNGLSFCSKCGAFLPMSFPLRRARFCSRCGAAVANERQENR